MIKTNLILNKISSLGTCTEIGWGSTTTTRPLSKILQWDKVSLLENSKCQSVYSTKIPDSQILCAGQLSGGVGACMVMIMNFNEKYNCFLSPLI